MCVSSLVLACFLVLQSPTSNLQSKHKTKNTTWAKSGAGGNPNLMMTVIFVGWLDGPVARWPGGWVASLPVGRVAGWPGGRVSGWPDGLRSARTWCHFRAAATGSSKVVNSAEEAVKDIQSGSTICVGGFACSRWLITAARQRWYYTSKESPPDLPFYSFGKFLKMSKKYFDIFLPFLQINRIVF